MRQRTRRINRFLNRAIAVGALALTAVASHAFLKRLPSTQPEQRQAAVAKSHKIERTPIPISKDKFHTLKFLKPIGKTGSIVWEADEPTVSSEAIIRELRRINPKKWRGKNAEEFAELCFQFGKKYAIHPYVAFIIYRQESNCGAKGLATNTNSVGNIKYTHAPKNPKLPPINYENYRNHRSYKTWQEGLEDLFRFLRLELIEPGFTTPRKIFKIYAPYKPDYADNFAEFEGDLLKYDLGTTMSPSSGGLTDKRQKRKGPKRQSERKGGFRGHRVQNR